MIHSAEDVRDGLALCFLRNGVDRPQWLADLAGPVVRMALDERDRELDRLAAEIELLWSRLAVALEDPALDPRPPFPCLRGTVLENSRAQGPAVS